MFHSTARVLVEVLYVYYEFKLLLYTFLIIKIFYVKKLRSSVSMPAVFWLRKVEFSFITTVIDNNNNTANHKGVLERCVG
jgi:hypothetical protein